MVVGGFLSHRLCRSARKFRVHNARPVRQREKLHRLAGNLVMRPLLHHQPARDPTYNFDLPAALAFAQRAFAIAESFFLAAGLIFRFAGALTTGLAAVPAFLTFAHRAF
jgi:hypothetical protein